PWQFVRREHRTPPLHNRGLGKIREQTQRRLVARVVPKSLQADDRASNGRRFQKRFEQTGCSLVGRCKFLLPAIRPRSYRGSAWTFRERQRVLFVWPGVGRCGDRPRDKETKREPEGA